jgi:hypothetical protein
VLAAGLLVEPTCLGAGVKNSYFFRIRSEEQLMSRLVMDFGGRGFWGPVRSNSSHMPMEERASKKKHLPKT